ncbi:MAG: vitamin K epoxide reductase family protein [Armatimonadota bacterium]
MHQSAINRTLFLLSMVGLIISGYLWKMHATPSQIPCVRGGGWDCRTVAESPYSQFPMGSGPPVAAWGFAGYLALAALAFLRTLPTFASRDRILLAGIVAGASFAAAASLTLTWVQLVLIKAKCIWCFASEAIVFSLLILSVVESIARRRRGDALPKP